MRVRSLLIAYGLPTGLLLIGVLVALIGRDSGWAFVPLGVAALTSPLWAALALRIDHETTHRRELLDAIDFQLTMLCGYLLGAVLLLIFIGVVVIFVVLAAQVAVGAGVVWQVAHRRAVPEPRVKLPFTRRLGLA